MSFENVKSRKRLTPSAVRVYIALMDIWGLPIQIRWDLLGPYAPFNLQGFKRDEAQLLPPLSKEQMERIVCLLRIGKLLRQNFDEKLADHWIDLPNDHPIFSGKCPIEIMIEEGRNGFKRIEQFLISQRQKGKLR